MDIHTIPKPKGRGIFHGKTVGRYAFDHIVCRGGKCHQFTREVFSGQGFKEKICNFLSSFSTFSNFVKLKLICVKKAPKCTRMYQHILSLCMFNVFGNSHGWLIGDNVSLADSFVLLSADWPINFAAEHVE